MKTFHDSNRFYRGPQLLWHFALILITMACTSEVGKDPANTRGISQRQRISLNKDWRFFKYTRTADADSLIYDVRPDVKDRRDDKPADSRPTEAEVMDAPPTGLKAWILPTGNDFIADPANRHKMPDGNPGSDFPFVQNDFDDSGWEQVDLPHDWAIKGPFMSGPDAAVTGGMGRLPSPGVAWYRKTFTLPAADARRSIFLDVGGAMSYAMVWLNGKLVGGWPYGYASWRVDLTPHIISDGENQLAIRLDNPPYSSRWYPGGGIYRNVWLTKTNKVHIAQWGTFVRTRDVSEEAATIDLAVTIENDLAKEARIRVETKIFALDDTGKKTGDELASFDRLDAIISAGKQGTVEGSLVLRRPRLWGPPPNQSPNRYLAITTLWQDGKQIDNYETPFGIRSLQFDAKTGVYVNGEQIRLKGANQHHDLGALGGAFNIRAAERQLEILREMGCNAIRMAP